MDWTMAIRWCEQHSLCWTIINNHFYWQTKFQTGEITSNNKTIWHGHDYFDYIIHNNLT